MSGRKPTVADEKTFRAWKTRLGKSITPKPEGTTITREVADKVVEALGPLSESVVTRLGDATLELPRNQTVAREWEDSFISAVNSHFAAQPSASRVSSANNEQRDALVIDPATDTRTLETRNGFPSGTIEGLLGELFQGIRRLTYQAIVPGMSGAAVFHIQINRGRMGNTYVVKIGRAKDIRSELNAWKEFVVPNIRAKYRPALFGSGFDGKGYGAVAYEFFARDTLNSRLVKAAQGNDVATVKRYVKKLLTIMSPFWDLNKQISRRNIMQNDYPLIQIDLDDFSRLAAKIPAVYAPSADDVQLIRRIWSGSPVVAGDSHWVSLCHGDLWGNNVLIDDEDDYCLIDFSHTKEHHYLRDFITLEGDLMLRLFPPGSELEIVDRVALERVKEVTCPPFPKRRRPAMTATLDRTAPLEAAVRLIREKAWGRMENKAREVPAYEIGLIRRLVRSSVRPENDLTTGQRWVGVHLAAAFARHLVHSAPASRGQSSKRTPRPPTRTTVRSSSLMTKVMHARRKRVRSFLIVGAIYLDVTVQPVDPSELRGVEWSNLDPVTMELGGSAIQVGRVLLELFDTRSQLFTTVGGGNDPFSRESLRLLNEERWIAFKRAAPVAGAMTAVSFQLHHPTPGEVSILTHRGALERLDWNAIGLDLLEEHQQGSVVYIGGYFRTRLRDKLEERLAFLGRQQITAIDHGGLVPELDNREAVRVLQRVFAQGLVDIYICTFDELWSLANRDEPNIVPPEPSQDLLHSLAVQVSAPELTVVRGERWPGRGSAFLVRGPNHHVERITETPRAPLQPNRTGLDNAFNAGFLYGLVTGRPEGGLRDVARQATRKGLRAWLDVDH